MEIRIVMYVKYMRTYTIKIVWLRIFYFYNHQMYIQPYDNKNGFMIGGSMKHKKTIKQKAAEIGYKKPNLEKKFSTIEKSFNEVKKILIEKK